jgi:flagellar biosynthetic protein FlhB
VAWAVAVGASLAQGGFVFAGEALTFKPERLSPVRRLGQLFSIAGLSAPAKSLIPFAVLLYLGTSVLIRDWELLARAGLLSRNALAALLYHDAFEIAWKSSLTLLLWAAVDYLLQHHSMENDLRMSKQELREEYKETDGQPSIKGRIRRLQRQLRRRRMLKDVEKATVVITNPTHFAVALEYKPEMAAPIMVAKGCNQMAERIKRVAHWREIPVMENKPLAQVLYRTVEVGQSIPSKLYVAVAELLAYLYRAQMRAQDQGTGGRS